MATKKRKAVKKAAPKKSVAKIVPLTEYQGYKVNRGSKDNISFGCGEVRVRKDDLRTLAESKIDKNVVRILSNNYDLINRLSRMNEGDLKTLINLVNSKNSPAAALTRVYRAARNRKSIRQILSIPRETLLRIAGN